MLSDQWPLMVAWITDPSTLVLLLVVVRIPILQTIHVDTIHPICVMMSHLDALKYKPEAMCSISSVIKPYCLYVINRHCVDS